METVMNAQNVATPWATSEDDSGEEGSVMVLFSDLIPTNH